MDHFVLRNGALYCEDVPLAEIAAEVGTPVNCASGKPVGVPTAEERANYDAYVGERSKKTSMGDILGDKLKAALKPGSEEKDGE